MNRKDINKAKGVLVSNMETIRNVSEWAEVMGYQRFNFSRTFRKQFAECPKNSFHKIRMQQIIITLVRDSNRKLFDIATDYGFRDEKALYDYVKYHRKLSPTDIRALNKPKKVNSGSTRNNFNQKSHGNFSVGESESAV